MVKVVGKFDTEAFVKLLGKLDVPMRESLARRMGASGGRVIRDEARRRAPYGGESGSWNPGTLKSAIYLAHNPELSAARKRVTYVVSWNRKIAPHGHLVEFGHWMPYRVRMTVNGYWVSNKDEPLPSPKWVRAYPFLRPAFDGRKGDAIAAMIQRGKEELPKLLRGDNV